MNYISVDKWSLATELRRGVVEIVFADWEDKIRAVKCSLDDVNSIPKQSDEDKAQLRIAIESATDVFPVWDVMSGCWGNIPLKKCITIQLVT